MGSRKHRRKAGQGRAAMAGSLGGRGAGPGKDGEKWLKHYSSNHRILLVGEGDFSFSKGLAMAFGSASNIHATSFDTYDQLVKKYKNAESNLGILKQLGASLTHGVDAMKLTLYPQFSFPRFDRIIFNFPHAGFYGKEDDSLMIGMHTTLLAGFFWNAIFLLCPGGEVHVTHKVTPPFSNWNIEVIAFQHSLELTERAKFRKDDYPEYNHKRGDGSWCDQPFPLGACCTFKFKPFPGGMNHFRCVEERYEYTPWSWRPPQQCFGTSNQSQLQPPYSFGLYYHQAAHVQNASPGIGHANLPPTTKGHINSSELEDLLKSVLGLQTNVS